jgi:hypothetical protein
MVKDLEKPTFPASGKYAAGFLTERDRHVIDGSKCLRDWNDFDMDGLSHIPENIDVVRTHTNNLRNFAKLRYKSFEKGNIIYTELIVTMNHLHSSGT